MPSLAEDTKSPANRPPSPSGMSRFQSQGIERLDFTPLDADDTEEQLGDGLKALNSDGTCPVSELDAITKASDAKKKAQATHSIGQQSIANSVNRKFDASHVLESGVPYDNLDDRGKQETADTEGEMGDEQSSQGLWSQERSTGRISPLWDYKQVNRSRAC